MNLDVIKNIAFEQLSERSSHAWKEKGNKYYHGERVAKLALTLRKLLFPDDDSYDDILTVAAWFHDIENGKDKHCERGAETTRALLCVYCTSDELDEICKIIAVHDQRWGDRASFTNAIKLHQDADLLDHYGTYEVLMSFLYMTAHGITLSEEVDFLKNKRPAESEYYRGLLNFELSRAFFDEKVKFMDDFTERFSIECEGELYDFERILSEYRQKELKP